MYLNPSNEEVSLSFETNSNLVTLNIFNLSGNLVLSREYETQKGKNTIYENNLGLKSGNYILILNDGENRLSKNLIIQNK